MKYSVWFLSVILLFGSNWLHAVQVKDLYSAQVDIEDQGKASREKAFGKGLVSVISKVSGLPAGQVAANIGQLPQNPGRFVEQYEYRVENRNGEDVQQLWVQFSESAVETMLENMHLPLWSAERPQTLVLLVDQEGYQRRVVTDPHALAQQAEYGGRQRGLPLLFPVMDVQDQVTLSPDEIWGGFLSTAKEVQERYGAPFLLIGRVQGEGSAMNVRWILVSEQETDDFVTSGQYAVYDGVNRLADRLGERYAVYLQQGSGSSLLVEVRNVMQQSDYASLHHYFLDLSVVESVTLVQITGATIRLSLSVKGGEQAFTRVVSLGHRLEPVEALPQEMVHGGVLYYRWVN